MDSAALAAALRKGLLQPQAPSAEGPAGDWGHAVGGNLELTILCFCLVHYQDLSRDLCHTCCALLLS